jgi:hypothetical protein
MRCRALVSRGAPIEGGRASRSLANIGKSTQPASATGNRLKAMQRVNPTVQLPLPAMVTSIPHKARVSSKPAVRKRLPLQSLLPL